MANLEPIAGAENSIGKEINTILPMLTQGGLARACMHAWEWGAYDIDLLPAGEAVGLVLLYTLQLK